MRQELVLLREKRYNYFPQRFLHRGVDRRVRRVERVWDVGIGWWRRPGHVFRVQCQDGARCDLFHDVALNAWYVRPLDTSRIDLVWRKVIGKGKLRWTFT
jgi:hypothetical protein